MNDEELHDLLRAHGSDGELRFTSGFADRVLRRVKDRSVLTLDVAIARHARRLLPALAAASMLLAAWNYMAARDRTPSTVGAVLGVASRASTSDSQSESLGKLTNAEAFE